MQLLETLVAPEWVDYNGHMNDAEYARAFSLAVEALMAHIGLDDGGRHHHRHTIFTLETHLCYRREAHEGQRLTVNVTLLDADAKRLHAFFTMLDDGANPLATSEQMLMGMSQQSGRPEAFPAPIAERIAQLPRAAAGAWPELAGRHIAIPRTAF